MNDQPNDQTLSASHTYKVTVAEQGVIEIQAYTFLKDSKLTDQRVQRLLSDFGKELGRLSLTTDDPALPSSADD